MYPYSCYNKRTIKRKGVLNMNIGALIAIIIGGAMIASYFAARWTVLYYLQDIEEATAMEMIEHLVDFHPESVTKYEFTSWEEAEQFLQDAYEEEEDIFVEDEDEENE